MAESREERFVQRFNLSDGNIAVSWKRFRDQFEIVRIAKKYAETEEEEQIANLLLLMGPDSVPIYNQFNFHATEEGRTRILANVLNMFTRHFEPVRNVIFERSIFNSMTQGSKPIHQFITELQSQADCCDYGGMRDELIRDRIVVGVEDNKLREYLIDVDNLDLATCIRKAKQYVTHHAQVLKIAPSTDDNLDAVSRRTAYSSVKKTQAFPQGRNKCVFCGKGAHPRDRCPARNSRCHRCKEIGHWARSAVCKEKKNPSNEEVVSEETTEDTLEGLFLGSTDSQ